MLVGESIRILHAIQELANALCMSHRAVFVTHEQSSQVAKLVVKLSDLTVETVILGRVHFHLGL